MSPTVVDSRIAANLPSLGDSALHADFSSIIGGPLEAGRDIADTCDVHEDSEDEDDEPAQQGGASAAAASQRPQPAVARTRAAATPQPRKRRAPSAQSASSAKHKGKQHKRIKLGYNTPIAVRQRNPKRTNTVSYGRYERYKHAKSRGVWRARRHRGGLHTRRQEEGLHCRRLAVTQGSPKRQTGTAANSTSLLTPVSHSQRV